MDHKEKERNNPKMKRGRGKTTFSEPKQSMIPPPLSIREPPQRIQKTTLTTLATSLFPSFYFFLEGKFLSVSSQ